MYEKELKSITKNGFLVPILVREKDDAFEIIDGEHRWKAGKALGMSEIPVNNLGVVKDSDAKTLTVLLNEIRGKAESGLMADLMKDLEGELGRLNLEDIMPFASFELDNLLDTAGLDFDIKDDPDGGLDAEGFRRVSYNLPEGVADQLEAQVKRFKQWLHPDDNPKDVSPVQAIEAMCQHLSQIEHLG